MLFCWWDWKNFIFRTRIKEWKCYFVYGWGMFVDMIMFLFCHVYWWKAMVSYNFLLYKDIDKKDTCGLHTQWWILIVQCPWMSLKDFSYVLNQIHMKVINILLSSKCIWVFYFLFLGNRHREAHFAGRQICLCWGVWR